MTLKWTGIPPTQSGLYWFRMNRGHPPTIVQVVFSDPRDPFCASVMWPGNEVEDALAYVVGDWSGPIPLPEEMS